MKIFQPSKLFRLIYPGLYREPQREPTVYLTFDDGPCPDTTPTILEILKRHNVRATFFCVGHNAECYPQLLNSILTEGHHVGNHTMQHDDGWKTPLPLYLASISEADRLIKSRLFRPPHLHLTPCQHREIRRAGYRIVLSDIMCYDWEPQRSPTDIQQTITRYVRNGSIIVLHDSVKASARVLPALDGIICRLKSDGYTFDTL